MFSNNLRFYEYLIYTDQMAKIYEIINFTFQFHAEYPALLKSRLNLFIFVAMTNNIINIIWRFKPFDLDLCHLFFCLVSLRHAGRNRLFPFLFLYSTNG